MRLKWPLWILALCLLACRWTSAETPQDLFKSGNSFYAAGKFAEAAQTYQSAADAGLRHWTLEYNLGNAYYRSGQVGRAVLHYERAFRLNTGDHDVLYNLNLAATKAGDPVLPSSALPALGWKLFYFVSLNTLTVITSLLFLALAVLSGFLLAGRQSVSSEAVVLAAAAFIVAAGWLGVRVYFLEQPEGVVVATIAEVRSGPNTTYPANFTIPEGRRVLILKEQEPIQGWLEIGVPQEGLKGWVPDSSVQVI